MEANQAAGTGSPGDPANQPVAPADHRPGLEGMAGVGVEEALGAQVLNLVA